MSPKIKSKSIKTRSRKILPTTEKVTSKKALPKERRSKPCTTPKTPKNKKKTEPTSASSTTNPTCSSTEENKNSKYEDMLITPKVMKYCLNAYKQSPDYEDLKKKRFNTSFRYECPRRHRDIRIFTPEEDNSPKWSENVPLIENKIQGEPGETYADIFMSIPGLSDSDEDVKTEEIEETKDKCVGKKGRKKSIGYKGVPLPDECLLTDYTRLFYSPE